VLANRVRPAASTASSAAALALALASMGRQNDQACCRAPNADNAAFSSTVNSSKIEVIW
jgi:hypothetical protein